MNEANAQLLAAARTYVTDIYQHRIKPEFVFHSLEHTEDVVEACSHMADYYQLHEEDRLVLMLAAWFHDTGYSAGAAEGHEDASVQLSTQFLQNRRVDETIIQRVGSCIQATRMPQSPVSLIEKILCDADLHHLATEDFKARNGLLKQERENLLGHKIDKKEWRKSNAQFLMQHQYFTDYGQEILTPKKMDNLALFQKRKEQKALEVKKEAEPFPYLSTTTTKQQEKEQKETERGIQTMFRTTANNHMNLSGMADNKANIMITVNTLILGLAVPNVISRLDYIEWYDLVPIILLVLTCLISITFAVLATRPSVNKGKFTEEDIRNKQTNLLFFGNFHQMQLTDYQWGMNQMIKDKEYLYNTMMMDVYFLGVVLAKKYRLLRISYTVFMIGLILTVLGFGIAALTPDASATTSTTETIDF